MEQIYFYKYKTTLTTPTTLTTLTTLTTPNHTLFNNIFESNIIGRELELFLPLFFIAEFLGQEMLVEIIRISKDITAVKKHEQQIESYDMMVYDFISKKEAGLTYYSVKQLTNDFREFAEENEEWLNSKWFGRALARLNLVVDKRRLKHGIEVMLNIAKAKEKFKMFGKEEDATKT